MGVLVLGWPLVAMAPGKDTVSWKDHELWQNTAVPPRTVGPWLYLSLCEIRITPHRTIMKSTCVLSHFSRV